jgi:hypothetical protein
MKQTTPTRMQAAAINRFGGIETIQLQTLPVPNIGPDEVLIRVEIAGVGVCGTLSNAKEVSPRCLECSRSFPTC